MPQVVHYSRKFQVNVFRNPIFCILTPKSTSSPTPSFKEFIVAVDLEQKGQVFRCPLVAMGEPMDYSFGLHRRAGGLDRRRSGTSTLGYPRYPANKRIRLQTGDLVGTDNLLPLPAALYHPACCRNRHHGESSQERTFGESRIKNQELNIMDSTYIILQHYWWFLVSLLGALLVFLLFVQGGQSLLFTIGKTELQQKMLLNSTGRKWEFTFTTLVTFGGAFFASFPLFYSTSFGGAYYVWFAILFVFVIQAVAYEYRRKPANLFGERTFNAF